MRTRLALLVLLISSLIAIPQVQAAGKVVVILVDGLDWARLPNVFEEGTVGAMNSLTAGRLIPDDTYLSLGAGSRARAWPYGGEAGDPSEVGDVFFRRTGIIPGNAAVVHPEIARIRDLNADLDHRVTVGALGEEAKRLGLRIAVIGNADTSEGLGRYAVLLAMDGTGVVPWGEVGSRVLMADSEAPFGVRTNWEELKRLTREYVDLCDITIVETGDLHRLRSYQDRMLPARRLQAEQAVLRNTEQYIDYVLQLLKGYDRWRLIVLAPTPSPAAREEGDTLTPIAVLGSAWSEGVLTSATTRREGLVANIDLVPTILEGAGFQAEGLPGRPMVEVEGMGLEEVKSLRRRLLAVDRQRSLLIRAYILSQIVTLLGVILLLLSQSRRLKRVFPVLFALSAVPLGFLAVPLIGMTDTIGAMVLTTLSVTFAGLVVWRLRVRWRKAFLVLYVLTGTGIALDLWAGQQLMLLSPLGYSALSGARYYGLGNEYMGVFIGSTLLAVGLAADLTGDGCWQRWLAYISLAFALLSVAVPGVNFGGTVAAAVGFGILALRVTGIRGMKATLAALMLLLLMAVGGMILVDLLRGELSSHVARAFLETVKNGPVTLREVVVRKASMNLTLLRYTLWTRVLLVSLATVVVLLYRPVGALASALRRSPRINDALVAAVWATIVALVVNDSGVVAAATAMIYIISPILCLYSEERFHA